MACSGGCGAVSPAQAHCGSCHRTFGGVGNFDRHRVGGQCLSPEGLGLTRERGVWREPMTAEARNRLRGTSGSPSGSSPDLEGLS